MRPCLTQFIIIKKAGVLKTPAFFISVFRRLSASGTKQKTTRYAGGKQKVKPKKSPFVVQ